MIRGVPVTLFRKVAVGEDEMGEPVVKDVPETIDDVLWSQPADDGSRLPDGTRPLGTEDTVTIHLPKTYAGSVAGCEFEIRGGRYKVEGDPVGFMPELTPGRWNRCVTARRVEG